MLFSSLIFLFFFLPALLAIYYCSPKNWRNSILLFFSIIFYAWGGVSYSIILIVSIVFNFFIARGISRSEQRKKRLLITGIVFNVLLLVSFKYLGFITENINSLFALFTEDIVPFPALKILLPLGISFYTFQQMSMLWDVYRMKEKTKIGFSETALYISLFPQLVAGPIVRYNDIIDEIRKRRESLSLFSSGVERFIIGLFKKIVIANTCGLLVDTILQNDIALLSTSAAWLAIVAYAIQIYFDFSGYSDMAIGLGRMFGFNIAENFNFPYIARSIREFWQRWHISLSTWFRDYVYIPLGGNRRKSIVVYRNLLIVFLLTGFWHGATWSFVFWGLFHGFFLVIERVGFGETLKKLPSFISWGYTILVVLIGWVFFRIEDFPSALEFVQKLFGFGEVGQLTAIGFINNESLIVLLLAIVMSLEVEKLKHVLRPDEKEQWTAPSWLVFAKNFGLILMFVYAVIAINFGSYNPFIYFRF